MSSKRRARSSSSSSSDSGSSSSSSSGSSTSSGSSEDAKRQSKSQLAKKRPRSKSPRPAQKERSRTEGEQRRSFKQHSPSRGHDRSDRPASWHRSNRRSPSPLRQPSGRSSRDYPYGDSKHDKVDRQQATDSRDRYDRNRQQDRSRHGRRDEAQEHRRDKHANENDDRRPERRREDQHHSRQEAVKPSKAQDQNGRDTDGHASKRYRSDEGIEHHQAHSTEAIRGSRDATGLPGPPPDRSYQAGAGRPPKGSGGRQNRWAQDGPLDKVPPGKEQWGKPGTDVGDRKGKEDKPEPEANFALSGKLAAESNTVKGVVLLHQEPPEARKPSQMWRLYGFKNGEPINKPLYIHRQTCYLFGRERRVADVPLDHPSISKQHAVLQYRFTDKQGGDSMMHSDVRPYLMDLGSANGTYLNNERIEPERYYELLEKDMVRFGHSTREYVLLHAQSND